MSIRVWLHNDFWFLKPGTHYEVTEPTARWLSSRSRNGKLSGSITENEREWRSARSSDLYYYHHAPKMYDALHSDNCRMTHGRGCCWITRFIIQPGWRWLTNYSNVKMPLANFPYGDSFLWLLVSENGTVWERHIIIRSCFSRRLTFSTFHSSRHSSLVALEYENALQISFFLKKKHISGFI